MKQGSTDDPFADEGGEGDQYGEDHEDHGDTAPEASPGSEAGTTEAAVSDPPADESGTDASSGDDGSGPGRLPYIYARESVKDGRQQRPIFLRDEVEDGIPELVDELEAAFGENVYRTDVMEAAVEVAQEHPDLVAEKLGEWGYGWD